MEAQPQNRKSEDTDLEEGESYQFPKNKTQKASGSVAKEHVSTQTSFPIDFMSQVSETGDVAMNQETRYYFLFSSI